ncbi:hypothetical protein CR51_41475 [Caballeronia megalochromosomata]|nr:hypothetical protein CR51_41475 [Caballeronia megalochromosomata]
MNFLRGVLARARGEASRVRPRRDYHGPARGFETCMEVHETQPAERRADSKPGDETSDHEVFAQHAAPELPARAVTARAAATPEPSVRTSARSPGAAAHEAHYATPPPPTHAPAPPMRTPHAPEAPPMRSTPRPPTPRAVREHDARTQPPVAAPPHTQIDIRIGKLEIAPPTAPRATPAPARANPAPLTLAEYLARRSERR